MKDCIAARELTKMTVARTTLPLKGKITRVILWYRLDEGLYRCEAIDKEDSCTDYFTA